MPPSPSGLPYAMQRTPVRSGNEWNTLADGFDQRLEVLERAAGQHAMTEVEDVARPPRRQPASRSTRQSSEMTSAPELAISSSSPAVEVPKWILGTPSARVASKIRRVEGNTRAS